MNYHYFRYEKGDPGLSPEKSYQLDLGLGLEEDLTVQISPFFNYFPNYIYLNPTSGHDYFYGAGNQVFNYAQSRVMRYGSELQAEYHFLKYWRAGVAGEYLYSKQLSGLKRGYGLPFAPPASALASLTYEPSWNGLVSGAYFTIDCRFAASQNRIVPPERPTPVQANISFVKGDGKLYLLLIKKSANYNPRTIEEVDLNKAIVYDVHEHKNEQSIFDFGNAEFDMETFTVIRAIPDLIIGSEKDNNAPGKNVINGAKAWESGEFNMVVIYQNTTHNKTIHKSIPFTIDYN
ncbi:TonB-dependent receptor domain-containing protein [Dyadobacter fermentans]|uniref:TonB-dependent receptor domain-containing protein n=1 Tax=Dyadobacter fermentans TaxID=94254 RepID=UPI0002E56F64|nr:TonB-dependent receptor [Dyadobacter fermentans]